MAIKKSELYSSLWASCDELRGGMDASQYKDYVLVLLFIKYISDKFAGVAYAPITVPKGSSFKDMVALKGKPTIGDDINKKIIGPIADANKLSEMPDFSNEEKLGSGPTMVKTLSNLIAIFENPALDFSKNRAEGDDILGDAYEYLMRHFATESGKSKGQFYTPAEVSRVMAKIIGIKSKHTSAQTTVYDPTCGSGSLLLKVADEAETQVSIYGQEMDNATAALARMNMILHNNPTAIIERENTLSTPRYLDDKSRLKMFDFVVANPPFSFKSWMNGVDPVNDPYERFKDYGTPPTKKGDYAFLLHIIRSLKSKGKGAIILPHGVLFRGNTEADIRTNIIKKGYIKGIIGLPANLFYGTGIPACIIVLDKENAENRKGIFMIDASKGFVKDGNKNRLRDQDIHKIVDIFNKQIETSKYSRMVSHDEIEKKNEYNLNIPRYIDSQEVEDIQDIDAHLKGDIPESDINALESYWAVYPSLKGILFGASKRKNYCHLKVAADNIKETIFTHPEFTVYSKKVNDVFAKWKTKNIAMLKGVVAGVRPKKLINELSEDLLQAFEKLALIDRYDVYQNLMMYWNETMQDDVYDIAVDGWNASNGVEWDAKSKEFEGRIIPKKVMTDKYFVKEQKAIEALETERDSYIGKLEEMEEEHGGDEGFFAELEKVNKVYISKRLKELKGDKDAAEEIKVLKAYLNLAEQEAAAGKKIKEACADLDKKLQAKYKALTEYEAKDLAVSGKWMAAMYNAVQSEMHRISQCLTQRIKELAERYETPLPALISETEKLASKADEHLTKMGFKW